MMPFFRRTLRRGTAVSLLGTHMHDNGLCFLPCRPESGNQGVRIMTVMNVQVVKTAGAKNIIRRCSPCIPQFF